MDQRGITPLISAVLLTAIGLAVVGIALNVIIPTMQNLEDETKINKAEQTLKQIERIIDEVAFEGIGSSREITVQITEGEYTINAEQDIIKLTQILKQPIIANRYAEEQGEYFISSNANTKVYETIINGENKIIMENQHLKIQIMNLDENATKRPSEIIEKIEFKNENRVFEGKITFYVDNTKEMDSNISTRAIKYGNALPRGEIAITVDNSKTYYVANIVLESGADFIRIYPSEVVYKT